VCPPVSNHASFGSVLPIWVYTLSSFILLIFLFVSQTTFLFVCVLLSCVPGPEGAEVVVLRRGAVTEAQIGETLTKHGMAQVRCEKNH
jgi:hypothetical protein